MYVNRLQGFNIRTSGFQVRSPSTPPSEACVYMSADQSAANYTTATAIAFNTELSDSDVWHDNSTNNSRLTVPAGITYARFSGSVFIQSLTASTNYRIELYKGGSPLTPPVKVDDSTGGTLSILTFDSGGLAVAEGNYFELFLHIDTDTSVTVTAIPTWFASEEIV